MSDVQSYVFDLQRVTDFFDRWNVDWKATGDFGVNNKFQIVLSSYAPNNIEECLDNGRLSSDVTVAYVKDCRLDWINEVMTIANTVTFNIGDDISPLKAVFIRNKASKVVLGYSINTHHFEVTNKVIFSAGTILWSIRDG